MGMNAFVLAIGKFSPSIIEDLSYPKEFYIDTKQGAVVTSHLLSCNTTVQSKELANALGFDHFDFNKHWIKYNSPEMQQIDYNLLRVYFDDDEVDRTSRLVGAGFNLLYLPEM